jgi:hypothetical protein
LSRADKANKMDWALQLAEKLIRGEFCNKGTALAGPQMQQNKGRALQLAEKLIRGEFCNKGTALAGPQMQQNKGRALAPAGLSSESSPSFRGFSAACLAPEGGFSEPFPSQTPFFRKLFSPCKSSLHEDLVRVGAP